MGQVNRVGAGCEFVELNAIGKRLVNEFQRQHPHLCFPSPDPSYRYIRRGFPEENVKLERLIDEIRARDLQPTTVVLQFARRKASR
jgi:hypothetical protein